MSVRRLDSEQPESFAFNADNGRWAQEQIRKYPEGKEASAVIPLLWRAQEQNDGWLPEPAMRHVAELLDMAYIRVYEVATFYTMFNLSPVGRHYVQLCGTTPCVLRGADDLRAVCRRVIGEPGHMTEDGLFSWIEVECLGACVNAPMVQINKDYFEDLTGETFEALLEDLREGREVKPGPQVDRQFSCPNGGPTTLTGKTNGRSTPPTPPAAPEVEISDEDRPEGLESARGGRADDLKRIGGIGPKIEKTLHELGIFHFDQIAAWTDENVAWVDDHLGFKGRVGREDWIGQAKALAAEEGA
ncbi:MAG: NADH-quinone oxidoreductase subunit NuoE [Methyloligellaceae bacterium]